MRTAALSFALLIPTCAAAMDSAEKCARMMSLLPDPLVTLTSECRLAITDHAAPTVEIQIEASDLVAFTAILSDTFDLPTPILAEGRHWPVFHAAASAPLPDDLFGPNSSPDATLHLTLQTGAVIHVTPLDRSLPAHLRRQPFGTMPTTLTLEIRDSQ